MKKVAVIGSINIDHVLRIKKFPELGETIIAESYEVASGGKGANQAASMGKLGVDVQIFGKIGNDTYGNFILKNLEKCNVDIENVLIDKAIPTGSAFINVDRSGDNSIIVVPGANGAFNLHDIKEFKNRILENDIVVLQMEISKSIVNYIIEEAKKSGKHVLLNFSPISNIKKTVISKVDFLVLNEVETGFLTNKRCTIQNLRSSIREIRKFYYNKLIITLGSNGAAYSISGNDFKVIPAFNVEVVDTTGAGDSFIGGFIYGLVNLKNIEDCIYLGNATGSLTTMISGAQKSFPGLNKLNNFLTKKLKIKKFKENQMRANGSN